MWAIFALVAALSWATADLLSKICMNFKGHGEYETLYSRFLFSTPILLAVVAAHPPKHIDPAFWPVCGIIIAGDILASTFYIKALKISPISVVVPLMSFAPVFMLISSSIMLREPPSVLGATGVVMVTAGAYALHLDRKREGVLAPFKALFKEKGPLMVIAAAAIFSIDTALGKKAVHYSDPFFFSFTYCLLMCLGYTPLFLKDVNTQQRLKAFFKNGLFWLIGMLFAAGVLSFLLAIKMANIAYVSAVGKISMVIAVIYGRIFFGEGKLKQKLAGVSLMLIGIFLILTGGLR